MLALAIVGPVAAQDESPAAARQGPGRRGRRQALRQHEGPVGGQPVLGARRAGCRAGRRRLRRGRPGRGPADRVRHPRRRSPSIEDNAAQGAAGMAIAVTDAVALAPGHPGRHRRRASRSSGSTRAATTRASPTSARTTPSAPRWPASTSATTWQPGSKVAILQGLITTTTGQARAEGSKAAVDGLRPGPRHGGARRLGPRQGPGGHRGHPHPAPGPGGHLRQQRRDGARRRRGAARRRTCSTRSTVVGYDANPDARGGRRGRRHGGHHRPEPHQHGLLRRREPHQAHQRRDARARPSTRASSSSPPRTPRSRPSRPVTPGLTLRTARRREAPAVRCPGRRAVPASRPRLRSLLGAVAPAAGRSVGTEFDARPLDEEAGGQGPEVQVAAHGGGASGPAADARGHEAGQHRVAGARWRRSRRATGRSGRPRAHDATVRGSATSRPPGRPGRQEQLADGRQPLADAAERQVAGACRGGSRPRCRRGAASGEGPGSMGHTRSPGYEVAQDALPGQRPRRHRPGGAPAHSSGISLATGASTQAGAPTPAQPAARRRGPDRSDRSAGLDAARWASPCCGRRAPWPRGTSTISAPASRRRSSSGPCAPRRRGRAATPVRTPRRASARAP